MLDFSGQTIIVTGASGNLGSAIARLLSRHGANLPLADMNEEKLTSFAHDRDRRFFGPDRNGSFAHRDLRRREFAESPWFILQLSGRF